MQLVARVAGSSAVLVPLKSLLRVSEKVQSEYAGNADEVCDFVRGCEMCVDTEYIPVGRIN